MDKIIITWDKYQECINVLTKKILASNKKYDSIFGIAKGGIVLAVSLSKKLDLPLVMFPTKNTLVVDDISDTGKTLLSFQDKYDIATIYSSEWTQSVPTYFIFTKRDKNHWVVFPWEVEEKKEELIEPPIQ